MVVEYLKQIGNLVEEWFLANFESGNRFSDGLYESMRYSFMAGGKRLRPALIILGYNLFDKKTLDINHLSLPLAVSVEMIHTYSLIHDDLPGMDNDDLRRGKPTNHVVYGEATAILAGDGLLTEAFRLILDDGVNSVSAERRAAAAFILLKAVGADGMVGGQYADIQAEGADISIETINYIHMNKTAALISGCIQAGGAAAGAVNDDLQRLKRYGDNIGLAFQVADDILDITSTTETLGKPVGSDEELDKLTYPKIYGIEKSKDIMNKLVADAINEVSVYGEKAKMFESIANFIVQRSM